MLIRARHLTTGVALLALALTGCSASAPAATSGTAATSGAAAAPVTAAAPSTSSASQPDADAKRALIESLQAGASKVKTKKTTTVMTMKVSGKEITIKASGSVDQTDPKRVKAALKTDMGGGSLNVVVDGTTLYTNLGGQWYKSTKTRTGVEQYVPGDPSAQIAKLASSIKTVTPAGEESIDGTATKHYVMTLDGAALSALSGRNSGGSATTKDMTYDAWVDPSGVIRKYAATMPGVGSMSGTVSAINEPVTIDIPTNAKPMPGS